MDGDDRAQGSGRVVPEDDQLVAVEFAQVEDFHPGTLASPTCTDCHKSCFLQTIGEIFIA